MIIDILNSEYLTNSRKIIGQKGQRGHTMRMHSYADILRLSESEVTTRLAEDESRLTRAIPAQRTGMVIVGQFEEIRTKDGVIIYVGENGQYLRK